MKRYRNFIITALIVITILISICFIPIDATKFVSIVEKQAKEDMGVDVHVEKLIFRFGPSLKIKAPVMHLMYKDGQKFGQLNNVKFYVPWSTLFKDNIYIKRIYADKCILKINSDDKYLPELIQKLNTKEYDMYPNIKFSNYDISYRLANNGKNYNLSGSNLELSKLINYHNIKIDTDGRFSIDDKEYISYNISITPNIEADFKSDKNFNIIDILGQIEALDFHSDIFADIKLYQDANNKIQISGLTNIDNISVLDKNKKNPKSFIYLTFLGNKTGILSNVYASPDKKIYVEGVVNNSQKPEIDIKVKTDKIKLAEMYNKIKLLIDCSKYKGFELTSGDMQADFTLKGDLNKIKSVGYLKISDAGVKANGLSINKINSDIDFSNNIISISNAVGYVNNAPILLKGQIDKQINLELLMDKVELKHLLPKSFGIQSGVISLDASLTGALNKIVHNENIHIEKLYALSNDNKISFDSLNINTNKDNVAYISNIQLTPKFTQTVKIPMLKLIIEGDKIKIPDTNIFLPNSKLQMKSDISNFNSSSYIFNVNVNGFINSKDIKGLSNVSNIYPVKLHVYGNKDAKNIESQIHLIKPIILDEPSLFNLNAKLENDVLKIDDLSILSFNGKFSNNFKSNLKGSKKLIVSGNVENFASPIIKNIRIYIPQQLYVNYKDTLAQIKGDLLLNGRFNQPEIVGQINVSNLINQFIQLSMSNLTVDFNKNVAIVNAPIVKIADSTFGINSTISTDFSKECLVKSINIKSKFLNFDTILMYKDTPIYSSIPLKIIDGKLYAEKASSSIYGGNLYLSALNSEFKIDNNILSVKNITSELYNGKLAGSLNYNLKSDKFNTNIQARGISAAPIFDLITYKKDTMSGAMDFDADLNGNLVSKESLNGDIKFIIHNGHMGMLGKLEHLLYAQNVVADSMLRTSLGTVAKAITLKDTGLFKYLNGDITMKNGIANIKSLQSQGPLMALFVKGQYNPSNDYAKLVILGRLSDEVTDSLGAFGEFSFNKLMLMLTGEDNKLNVYASDMEKLPQLPARSTKVFRTIINGIAEKPSSVIQFNWISYSQKSLRQKEVPLTNEKLPDFIEALPY